MRILETAMQLDGAESDPRNSPFLQMVCAALEEEHPHVTCSTIHGAKGTEAAHVVLFQFNLIGGTIPTAADRNLLYIAVTRARH